MGTSLVPLFTFKTYLKVRLVILKPEHFFVIFGQFLLTFWPTLVKYLLSREGLVSRTRSKFCKQTPETTVRTTGMWPIRKGGIFICLSILVYLTEFGVS